MSHWARGIPRSGAYKTKLENRYADYLELLKRAGEILGWWYESVNLKIGPGAWVHLDFLVWAKDGVLELRETKGYKERAGMVRLKAAAGIYPFRFLLCQEIPKKEGGGWRETII